MQTDRSGKRQQSSVSERVLSELEKDIFSGTLGALARLPAERELAERMDASRISVRRALTGLMVKNLIDTRRGSGTIALPRRNWAFSVLPAYLKHCAVTGDFDTLGRVAKEVLHLRRMLVSNVLCKDPRPLKKGDLDGARSAVQHAWEHRSDSIGFLRYDLEKTRLLFEASGKTASLWLINSIAEAYMDFAGSLPVSLVAPDDYVAVHMRFFAALEDNDPERAVKIASGFLEKHDADILAVLNSQERRGHEK